MSSTGWRERPGGPRWPQSPRLWSMTMPPHTRSTSTPTGANAGPRSPCRRSCARATRPSPACPRPLTQWPPRCRTRAAAPCQVKATGRHPRRWFRCSWTSSSPDQPALTLSRARRQTRCPNVKRRAKPQWHRAQMDLTSYGSDRSCRTAEPARVCATGRLMQGSRMVASLLYADIWPSSLSIDQYGIRRRTKVA